MAYPTTVDTLATNKGNATDATSGASTGGTAGDHAAHHNALATAVNAIEAELGADPSATFATVVARLAARQTVRVAADQSFTTQVLANATSLSFAVAASQDYWFKFVLAVTMGAARGIGVSVTTPAGITLLSAGVNIFGQTAADGPAANHFGLITASADTVVNTPTAGATSGLVVIEGILSNGATAGTLQVQARQGAGATAVNAVIKKGSWGEMYLN